MARPPAVILAKSLLIAKLLGFVASELRRQSLSRFSLLYRRFTNSLSSPPAQEKGNIVIIGASFAGLFAAHELSSTLSIRTGLRVVVVEPHSHFHFTWVLPRFSVVKGHEKKAFIPYSKDFAGKQTRWIQDRVVRVERDRVQLASGQELGYKYLLIATGSSASLPSRVGADGKVEGMGRLRDMQTRIEEAEKLVVVGGGAAGVELAADAKALYPDKKVTLVCSRAKPMHRFGSELQDASVKGLEELGVELVLGKRVVDEDTENTKVTLNDGTTIECDYLVNCAGQKAQSGLIKELSPSCVGQNGKIRVKPTLQVDDDALPHIYACGDVAETGVWNPNARSAVSQAIVAVKNIVQAAEGRRPGQQYHHYWPEGGIKLTLGLEKVVLHVGDGKTELLFSTKQKDVALDAGRAWQLLGSNPFEDGDSGEATAVPKEAAPVVRDVALDAIKVASQAAQRLH